MSTEIPDTDWTELPCDSHGTAILDIDREGLLDIYIATGGGIGSESCPATTVCNEAERGEVASRKGC